MGIWLSIEEPMFSDWDAIYLLFGSFYNKEKIQKIEEQEDEEDRRCIIRKNEEDVKKIRREVNLWGRRWRIKKEPLHIQNSFHLDI